MKLSLSFKSLALMCGLACLWACGGHAPSAASSSDSGPAAGVRVDNFGLFDHEGNFHRLYDYSDAKAVVLYVHGNACPIVRNAIPALKAVRDEYEQKGVVFLLLNANLQDERASIAKEAAEYGIDLPILEDEAQLAAEALEVHRTAEAIVINPQNWTIAFRGPIDDRLGYESQRKQASHHYLADALDAVLEGGAIAETVVKSPGCLVALPNKEKQLHADLTFTHDIAPILAERCIRCHQQGGIAPWAMSSYEMVRGWAPMIREVVRIRRMPPWHLDPKVGHFQGDLSLSTEEKQKIVHWVENGAPRGEGDDPLKALEPHPVSWSLGKPDIELTLAEQKVPATGVLDYRYDEIELPIDRDVWAKAVEVLPGNRAALHHALVSITYPKGYSPPIASRNRWLDGIFAGYAPGAEVEIFPEGTGRFLPKGSKLLFQLHYTTTGKEETDQTQFGIYLADSPPEREFFILGPFNPQIAIPPGEKHYTAYAQQEFDETVTLYDMSPHMHFRGKSMKYTAVYPDGRQETLLNVPYYSFNWQRKYRLTEPKVLPAGSKIVVEAVFDNSAQNTFNPDPSSTVYWGEQSFDEMLIGYMSLVKGLPKIENLATR